MTGNVVIDDLESDTADPLRPGPGWVIVLAATVVATLAVLPGSRQTEVSPTTLPEVVVVEDEWARLDLPGAGVLTDVATTAAGTYLAVGDGPQFWWSDDGTSWQWAPHEPEPGRVLAVTTAGNGGVAAGSVGSPGDTLGTIWTSEDGRAWAQAATAGAAPSGFEGVAVTAQGTAAWGWEGSAGMFDPETDALLFVSTDDETWEAVAMPEEGLRISGLTHDGGEWLVSGFFVGRPAAWTSPDLEEWTRIATDGLPFGWTMTEIENNDGRYSAQLVDLGRERGRRWMQAPDGSWQASGPISSGPAHLGDGEVGVSGGQLWVREGDWTPVPIEGVAQAVAGSVAVGAVGNQPTMWLRDAGDDGSVEVEAAARGRWQLVEDLGEGVVSGAWPLGDSWLVTTSGQWWLVTEETVEAVVVPTRDQPTRLVQVDGEWVILPSLHWTGDGRTWEQRSEPWPGALESTAGRQGVMAATVVDGSVVVLGTDSQWRWSVAESDDGGRTWQTGGDPAVTAPIWEVVGVPDGFVALFARQGGRRDVVVSDDGLQWETVSEGRAILDANVPVLLTPEGEMVLLDTGEAVVPPAGTPAAISRGDGRVMIVADNRLWVGPGEWEEILLDPPHGMSASSFFPISLGEKLLMVGNDRDQARLYEWAP